MNTCPTELHSYICQLACADDGHTSRSISRVSKYFNNVSRPFRYQIIAISGIDQGIELATRLETIPIHMRRIRHLFISDRSSRKIDRQITKRICDLERNSTIRLLKLAAPTVETLTFHTSCPATSTSLIAALFNIVFPQLVELVVIGYYPFPHVPGTMPRLKRMHLRGNRNPHGLLHMDSLRIVCPNLTHLRVSGLSMAISFVEELAEALKKSDGRDDDGDSTSLFAPRLPPRIRTLMVQPGPAPSMSGRIGECFLKDQMMIERLTDLVGAAGNTKAVRFVLCERDTQDGSYTYERARWDWSQRMNGSEDDWNINA